MVHAGIHPRRTIMSDEHYYDIYVSACGFLNRLRTVEHSDGQSSLVCTFAALRGAKGERAQPTYFDAKIVGDRTKALVEQFRNVINDRTRQVFVSVRLSDIYVKPFVRQKGERKGESGYSLKTRLLVVESLAVDGVFAYRRKDDPTVEVAARRGLEDSPRQPPVETGSTAPSKPADTVRPVVARAARTGTARA
jgi:hypothetical protein